jgi:F0F1-type ATP synthase membrane subunit a
MIAGIARFILRAARRALILASGIALWVFMQMYYRSIDIASALPDTRPIRLTIFPFVWIMNLVGGVGFKALSVMYFHLTPKPQPRKRDVYEGMVDCSW